MCIVHTSTCEIDITLGRYIQFSSTLYGSFSCFYWICLVIDFFLRQRVVTVEHQCGSTGIFLFSFFFLSSRFSRLFLLFQKIALHFSLQINYSPLIFNPCKMRNMNQFLQNQVSVQSFQGVNNLLFDPCIFLKNKKPADTSHIIACLSTLHNSASPWWPKK